MPTESGTPTSKQTSKYISLPESVYSRKDLSSDQKLILGLLASFQGNTPSCSISYGTIGKRLGMGRTKVVREINALKEEDLEKHRGPRIEGSTKRQQNVYVVAWAKKRATRRKHAEKYGTYTGKLLPFPNTEPSDQ